MTEQVMRDYGEALIDTDWARALQVIQEAVAAGMTPEAVVFEVVIPTIEAMHRSVIEDPDATLAQHFLTSEISAEVVDAMVPRFQKAPAGAGTVVMGTSRGDFHGLGKRIVIACLKARMIDVVDLGLNVSAETFVDEAVASGAQVIGISSMMIHTARGEHGCLGVREILRKRGLEARIKVVVGGAPYRFDECLYRVVQADAWAENGLAAAGVIARLIQEVCQ